MSTNAISKPTVNNEQSNASVLELELDTDGQLADLVKQVNEISDKAEDCKAAVVVIRLVACAANGSQWPGQVSVQDVNRWERALRRLEKLPAIIIAVAFGRVTGPAMNLLLTADYRIAAEDFQLRLPMNDGQIWPGMALHRLVNQVGVSRAKQVLLSEPQITAKAAQERGFIDEISQEPLESMRSAISRLHLLSGKEFSIRRQLLLEATTTSYEDALGAHLAACDRELRRIKEGN